MGLLIRRWCIILIGGVVVAVGLVLMPLPGPGGLPVTLIGLAILSSELPWAKLFLERIRQRAKAAVTWKRTDRLPNVRRLAVVSGLIALWIVGGIVVWRVWAS